MKRGMHPARRVAIFLLLISLLLAPACSGERPGEPSRDDLPDTGEPARSAGEERELARAAHAEREEERRVRRGEFYVPLPPFGEEPRKTTVEARALYMTNFVAGFRFDEEKVREYAGYIRWISGQSEEPVSSGIVESTNKLEKILGICEATEINALVIDVKNDDGLVAWESDIPLVNELNANWVITVRDYGRLMEYLKERDIYTIARVVAFKDPYLAEERPDLAIGLQDGGVYRDRKGTAWVNPFDRYVWDYNIAVSQEAALRGFDEIQYDYVRFPDNAREYNPVAVFPGRDGRAKDVAIEQFLAYAREKLAPYGVHVSADVFGVITRSWDDHPEDIGQTWRRIANNTDYICPMIYPSHYGENWYGFAVPDQHPYGVLRAALREALERNAAQEDPAVIRPWVQGFTAPWVRGNIRYDARAISDQMVAAQELGIPEYIIWSPGNNYDPLTFFYHDRIDPDPRVPGEDILGRTPGDTLERFLSAEVHGRWHHLYLLSPLGARPADYDRFRRDGEAAGIRLRRYRIGEIRQTGEGDYEALVEAVYESPDGRAVLEPGRFRIQLENDVFKVRRPPLTFVPEDPEETDDN